MLITDKEKLLRFYSYNRIWQLVPGIERTKKGRLFATFYSGAASETLGNYCMIVKSDDDGKTWTEPICAAYDGEMNRCFDSALWIDPFDRLWFTWSRGHEDGVYGSICENPDSEELCWGEEFYIGDDVMVNKPTVLSTGEWLFPIAMWDIWFYKDTLQQIRPYIDIHIDDYFTGKGMLTGANVYKTCDGGKTFTLIGGCRQIESRSHDEHMIYERQDGVLVMLMRTRYGIGRSYSYDGGVTWTMAEHSDIAGPGARFHVRRLKSGRLLLVNHDNFKGRNNMTAFLSEDDGVTWPYKLLLDERDEVSYPDMAEGEDGWLYIIYDRERGGYKTSFEEAEACAREILIAKINESDIIAGELKSEGGYLKGIVSKLGKYTGTEDFYKDYPKINTDEFINTVVSYNSADKILKTIFVYYPLHCQNMQFLDAKKMDKLIGQIILNFDNKTLMRKKIEELVKLLEEVGKFAKENREEPLVNELIKYLQTNFDEGIDINEYANNHNVSVYYLCHLFKKKTAKSIYEYRDSCRFAEAKRLLTRTDMKIQDICTACGFSDSSYFSKKFKELETISPTEYRSYHKA